MAALKVLMTVGYLVAYWVGLKAVMSVGYLVAGLVVL